MAQTTTLASGMVTASDEIRVELLDNGETPPMILIRWPAEVTPVQPGSYADAASKIMKVFAQANVRLTQIRRQ
jgi:hypothetical protein